MYLTVDIGTSSMKAGVISSKGELLAYGRHFFYSDPHQGFDARTWEKAFLYLLEELKGHPIDALSISSNGPTLIPVDGQGQPHFSALFWQDGRMIPQKGPSYYLPKVAWLKEHHPDVYRKTSLFLSPSEYLVYKLTGQALMASSDDRFTPYLWTEKQVEQAELNLEKLPPVETVGTRAGLVNPEGSSWAGLSEGIPCFLMGSDFQASLLGTGAVRPGVVCDRAGTSEGLNYCTDKKPRGRELRNLPHVIPGMWNSSAILSSTGALFEWFRELTGMMDKTYQEMLQDIMDSAGDKDPLYFFPSLKHGGLWEFSGGMLMGLEPMHGREDLGRVMLESIGFSVRRGVDLLERRIGSIDKLVLCGGQAKSPLWNQLKADLTGRSWFLPEIVDAELTGCACACSFGLGETSSLTEASDSLVRIIDCVSPSGTSSPEYDRRYRIYKKISGRVKSFYRKKLRIELDKI